MSTLSGDTRLLRTAGAESSALGEEFVVLDPNAETMRGLNPSAARLWQLIDGTLTIAQMAARVAQEFDASPAQVLEDALPFFERLLSLGLVKPA